MTQLRMILNELAPMQEVVARIPITYTLNGVPARTIDAGTPGRVLAILRVASGRCEARIRFDGHTTLLRLHVCENCISTALAADQH